MLQCWEYLVIHVFLPCTIWHFSLLVVSCGLYAVKFCCDSNHSCLIIFTRDVTNLHFFLLVLQVLVFVSSSPFPICFVFPQSVWTIHWSFCGLFVRFYVLTGILMLVYDSHNTVSTVTQVSEAVFLPSGRSEFINVVCNMFSSTGSPSPMPLCCNTSCQFALYLFYALIFGWTPFGCPRTRMVAVAFKTVTRIQCSCCNLWLHQSACACR
jgi:hypothetical protein